VRIKADEELRGDAVSVEEALHVLVDIVGVLLADKEEYEIRVRCFLGLLDDVVNVLSSRLAIERNVFTWFLELDFVSAAGLEEIVNDDVDVLLAERLIDKHPVVKLLGLCKTSDVETVAFGDFAGLSSIQNLGSWHAESRDIV